MPAGVAPLAGAEHEEPGRVQVQLLGRLLADALPRPPARRAPLLLVGQVVNHVPPFEVFGQRLPAVLVASARGLRVGRCGLLALAATTEPVPGGRVELGLQLGVLGQQLADQRLERGHVIGKRGVGVGERGVHARDDDRRAGRRPAKSVSPVSPAGTA